MHFSPEVSRLVSLSFNPYLVNLWDVATGDRLASMEVGSAFRLTDISFGVDGTSIILRDSDYKFQRWTLSDAAHNPNRTDNLSTPLPRLPMVFVPIQDTDPPALPDVRYYWGGSMGSGQP
jgi:hypothetical protein